MFANISPRLGFRPRRHRGVVETKWSLQNRILNPRRLAQAEARLALQRQIQFTPRF